MTQLPNCFSIDQIKVREENGIQSSSSDPPNILQMSIFKPMSHRKKKRNKKRKAEKKGKKKI